MKIKFSHIIRNLIFILLISLTSCEKELYEDSIQNSSRNLTVQHIKLNDIEKAISTKIESKISAIKKSKGLKEKTQNVEGRFEYNSNLDIYIDTENGKLVNDNGKISYTFPMFRKSEEKLENIVFVQTNSNDIETYIAKYNIKPEIFKELTLSEQSAFQPELQKMFFNTWWIVCIEGVEESEATPIDNGDLTGNFGYETVWNVTGSLCYMMESGDGGGGGGYPGGYNNGGNTGGNVGGGSHGGSGTGSNGVSTSPSLSPSQIKSKKFRQNLSDEENSCISGLSDRQEAVLFNFSDLELIENCDGSPMTEQQEFNMLKQIISETCGQNNNSEPEYDLSNYPGKEDGMPYEWWLDRNYIKNNFKILNANGILEEPNIKETILFGMFPIPAIIHIKNSTLALEKAEQLVNSNTLTGIHNGKADAYRHAFWNARDTADFGSLITKLFTDAHEWNSCNHPLETQMDLFNNGQGRSLGSSFNFFSTDYEISANVITSLFSGYLVYLNPLGSGGAIISSTQMSPTNL